MTCWICKKENRLADHCCFWCRRARCKNDHWRDMLDYRENLRKAAWGLLSLLKTADTMNMEDHWRKSFYQKYLAKGLTSIEASLATEKELSVIRYRNKVGNSNQWVSFSKKDRAAIAKRSARWKPKLTHRERQEAHLLKKLGF